MSVFYVFQGETYEIEREGGYVWSPQLNKAGRKNIGYTTMTEIRKDDFILHHSNGRILAVSFAETDCYESDQPQALKTAKTTVDWDQNGYRVDVEYHNFDTPLAIKPHTTWLAEHFIQDSAFQKNGRGKEQYMCHLDNEHASYLLRQAIMLQSSNSIKDLLSKILDEVNDEINTECEYNPMEKDEINEIIEINKTAAVPNWPGAKEKQAMINSRETGTLKPKRDVSRAADALKRANFQCEYNESDRTFLRKNGVEAYTEPHHLIPISKYRDFDYSVDVMENIVSLCSHCHNLLHYGQIEDKIPILEKLYNERIKALKKCGLDLTFDQLKKYYE